MPLYNYICPDNGWRGEVWHPMAMELNDWGHLCYVARIPLGDTDPATPVQREISTPHIITSTSDSDLKSKGFAKLVKRDDGVYENVTCLDHEQRYFKRGEVDSMPDLNKRIHD